MLIERLGWDSDFFGLKIGKCEIIEEKLFDPIEFKRVAEKENYDLIYVFKNDKLFSQSVITTSNLYLMDIMIFMSMKFDPNKFKHKTFDIKNKLSKKELLECYDIAEQTSIVSRFYSEPLIGATKTKKLYRKWVDNAISKKFCDGIFIEKCDDVIVGIFLAKTNPQEKSGQCSIIGVNQNIKGRGYGTKLWEQSLGYWSNMNIEKCVVPFSLQNFLSLNFHLKMGFNKVESIKYIYHYRKLL